MDRAPGENTSKFRAFLLLKCDIRTLRTMLEILDEIDTPVYLGLDED